MKHVTNGSGATPTDAMRRLQARRESNRKKKAAEMSQQRSLKLARRFGDDDRSWTEKNARWKTIADAGSWLAQGVGYSGAAYATIRLMYSPDWLAFIVLILSLVILVLFALGERWTSDEFWDSYWAGRPSWSYGALNFLVVAPLSIAVSLLGIYMFSYDTAGGPQFSTDPQAQALQQKVIELREERTGKEEALAVWREDPANKVSSGRDKGKIYYNKIPQETKQVEAIAAIESQIAAAEQQLSERHGVVAIQDTEILSYHQFVVDTKTYFAVGISLLIFLMFEVCMSFRSKYDAIEYEELQLAQLEVTPNGIRRTAPTPASSGSGNF